MPTPVIPIKLAIAGALGRTGDAVVRLAGADPRFDIVAALATSDDAGKVIPTTAGDITTCKRISGTCDVLIDFTLPAGTMTWLDRCLTTKIAMVIGATGHDNEQLDRIRSAAATIPIVMASNFSVGITALVDMIGKLTKTLGDSYDIEIVESHHRHKVDAPSGTALTLLDEMLIAKNKTRDDATFGRHGKTGERKPGTIGVHAVRRGEIVGEHEIHFSAPGETLTLRHTAHARDTFATGALRAAAWLTKQPAGLYRMTDVLRAGA